MITAVKTLGLFLAFFVGAHGEELGWSGYAIDPLQERYGAFLAAIVHAMSNLTWQLFPIDGSFYDPRVTGPILAVGAALVIIVWGHDQAYG